MRNIPPLANALMVLISQAFLTNAIIEQSTSGLLIWSGIMAINMVFVVLNWQK